MNKTSGERSLSFFQPETFQCLVVAVVVAVVGGGGGDGGGGGGGGDVAIAAIIKNQEAARDFCRLYLTSRKSLLSHLYIRDTRANNLLTTSMLFAVSALNSSETGGGGGGTGNILYYYYYYYYARPAPKLDGAPPDWHIWVMSDRAINRGQ